jgi:hypothetical protein
LEENLNEDMGKRMWEAMSGIGVEKHGKEG